MSRTAAGVAALNAIAPIERALNGRIPIYDATRMLHGIPKRYRFLSTIVAEGSWASVLGGVWGRVRTYVPKLLRVPLFAGAILGIESVLLPAMKATPPLGKWRKRERALWALHVLTFATAYELAGD